MLRRRKQVGKLHLLIFLIAKTTPPSPSRDTPYMDVIVCEFCLFTFVHVLVAFVIVFVVAFF